VGIVIALQVAKYNQRADKRDEERSEREREEAEAANRASLLLWATGSEPTLDHRRCAFRIQNNGKVIAHDVHVWLRGKDGNDVSTSPQPNFDLAPDQADDTHAVPVPLDVDLNDLRFTVSWNDSAGPHTWPTPFPPY
jgi:hypothetical protein